MSKITIKDTELDLDIYDADENERVLSAIQKAQKALTAIDGGMTTPPVESAMPAMLYLNVLILFSEMGPTVRFLETSAICGTLCGQSSNCVMR